MERPKTIFLDIDGTLVKHKPLCENTLGDSSLELLEGTLEKLTEWDLKGYRIILTTGRKESLREATEQQLNNLGIFYDILIMGIGGGDRVLVNDKKSDGRVTAFAICPDRNFGIKDINI
jgi:hydroxymethylpyrimidine pyrophosphatase-like HAD family hydrolase